MAPLPGTPIPIQSKPMRSLNWPWMVILLFLWAPSAALSQQTVELHGGRWVQVAAPTTQQEQMDEALYRVEQLLQERKFTAARDAAVAWLKTHRGSPFYDRGLFLEAEALYHYGDRIRSFFYLDQLMDEHPESPLFYQAMEKQYQIADAYLSGYKRRFMGMPMFGAQDEAIEMLFRVQQRSPKSAVAEKSLLRSADYYYASAQYDLAADAYRSFIESFPRSTVIPRVKLRRAYASLAQFRGLKFDSTPVSDAKLQLQEIIASYPELAKEENLESVVERIDQTFARKLAYTADFYRRTNEPGASAYTYEYLRQRYPNSQEGQRVPAPVTPEPAPTTAPATP